MRVYYTIGCDLLKLLSIAKAAKQEKDSKVFHGLQLVKHYNAKITTQRIQSLPRSCL